MEDGLSDYNISRFFQDSRGVMWISTNYGLNRYDGTSIKVYHRKELDLGDEWVTNIAEDANRMLWINCRQFAGTRSIGIFDPLTEKAMSIEEYTGYAITDALISPSYNGVNMLIEKTDSITQFYELNEGQLKFAFKVKNDALEVGRYAYKLSRDTFLINSFEQTALTDSTFKRVLVNTVYVNDSGEISRLTHLEESLGNRIDVALKGNAFGIKRPANIISRDNISYSLDLDTLKIYSPSGQLLEKKVLALDSNGKIFDDKDGNLWCQSDQRSFCILSLREQKFKVEAFDESSPFATRGIVKTTDGTIYAHKTGLGLFNLFRKTSENAGLIKSFRTLKGMLEADRNNLWIAFSGGLIHYDTKTQNEQQYSYPPYHGNFWQPYKSPGGDIWCGLARLDTLTKKLIPFRDYSNFPILENSHVYAFHTNEKGTWLSTSAGLFLVDLKQEKILEHYSDSQEGAFYIPSDHVFHLHEDQAGIFWLATKGSGLIRWDPKTKTSEVFSKVNSGLSHDVIYAVYEDDFDNLWLPSSWGLNSFNKTTGLVATYFEEDGIPNNEFNTIAHHEDKEGNLYFGTQNGFIHFHPKDFIQEKKDYPFIITACNKESLENDSITKLLVPLLAAHELTFYPSDKSINLDFALLDYQNLQSIQYSYKIEGYHTDWIYQKEPSLKVIGLPYGDYQLRLRAKSAASNYWQEYAQAITINVKKPFYLEWWFIGSCLIALAMSLFLFYKRRVNVLKERQQQLEVEIENATAQITEDKAKIEAQNEELRGMDKVKSNFFANISHELRTPLTLILGPLSYVLDSPEEWNKERVQQQLRVMQRNGKSLLQLIEEILDLSKLEAKKLSLEEEATSVHEFFKSIIAAFEPQFQSQGLDYNLILNLEDERLHVLLDRKKMEKVLNNYLSNAIKFTPQGNKITLTVSETATQLNIQVSDTGKGVHPNDLPHIFERFYQSKQAEQKLYGGTGIGLALVNEFAALMGGKAYAESTVGVGSQFYFELPKKPVSVHSVISTSRLTVPDEELEEELIASIGTDFTILVVEDNEDMRNFVCQLLEPRYQKILRAKNGAEGLELLKEHGLDIRLVISDVMMPEVDGLTMVKAIKNNPEWSGIPVIMLTALSAERDKMAALTIGVDDYLSKPFSVTELLARVQNLLFNYHQREAWQKSPEYLAEQQTDKPSIDVSPSDAQDKSWIHELEKIISTALATNHLPGVEALAASLNLSTRQFSRNLKADTGLSPAKFIKEVQLQQARKDLENGSTLSIKEVCYNNGFVDATTFSKVFKIRFGKSPSEYLKTVA